MGKFRSKLKGRTKGKRWPKGQSSSSNPETRKHRDLAKSRFFQDNSGTSGLTYDVLKKHDATQAFLFDNKTESKMEEEEDVESSAAGSYSSFQSFASDWSSFRNTLIQKVVNSNSALHKEMFAILAAITEVIKENNGTESSTEYYCSLLTTLEQIYNKDEVNNEQLGAVVRLLNMGIKTVPQAVLQKSFADVANKLLVILNDYADSDNNVVIKSVFGILDVLLCKQDYKAWSGISLCVRVLRNILNPFCIHSKPKWRKAAQAAACHVIKAHCFQEAPLNHAAELIAQFCEDTLERCMGGSSKSNEILLSSIEAGQTTILHVLGLMKDTIFLFSKTHIKNCCEFILRLITLNYPIVTSCGLQVLNALFSQQKLVMSAKLNAQLISALYDFQPAASDVQPILAWLLVMQQIHVHLADADLAMAARALPKLFTTFSQLWLSDKPQVMSGASHALEIVLKDAIAPLCATEEMVQAHSASLDKCFKAIEQGLSYQYHSVWHQILYLLGVAFEVGGPNCKDFFINPLRTLTELRDSYKFSYNNELEHAVGAAIRSLGPETVLNIVSLKKDNGELNMDRSWLLPVLKENIKTANLSYFHSDILPLAAYCQKRSLAQAKQYDGIGAHSSELLYMQLWSLLPSFCSRPLDIADSFKNLAKIIGSAISDRKELRLFAMAALRRLIAYAKQSDNPLDLEQMRRFDRNYLPILFNIYTTKPIGSDEEGQRLATLDTIKVYLTISSCELHEKLLNESVERLNASSDDPEDYFIKESILDLIRALLPYQQVEAIKTVYDLCVKSLPEIKNNKEQKKAYRLLEEICGSNSKGCLEFVKTNRRQVHGLLMKSLNSATVSSKGARLRCYRFLIKTQSHLDHESSLIRSALPEAILACKDINERARDTAFGLINTIGETLRAHAQMQKFIELLLVGLSANVDFKACTVLALSSVLHHFSGSLGQENIQNLLELVCELLSSETREVVGAGLGFVKTYCRSIPSPMVVASLPLIIKSLCTMTDDCKRHFRLRTRDILNPLVKKYGYESIAPHVPADDVVTTKRLRNLRKIDARRKRQREEMDKDVKDDDDDEEEDNFMLKPKMKNVDDILADSSDSEFDDDSKMETDQQKKKIKRTVNTWIEEDLDNIVDFTDNSAVSKIVTNKPGPSTGPIQEKKEKDRGFKTASDGRLIIKDCFENDNESDANSPSDHGDDYEDDDDDNKSSASTLLLSDRKRKRSGSVKSGTSSYRCPPMKYKTGGVGIHRNVKAPGAEFKSKKAKGDVKKKGKADPYAYIPLKRTALNKRKIRKNQGVFKNIVRAAKSGALKGSKLKKKTKT